MSKLSFSEKLMSMDEDTWLRHANPMSVWSRIATGPVLFFALWSHVWIGWLAAIPTGVIAIWIWLNPRVFSKPETADAWASKAVLGERVWLNRKHVRIPEEMAHVAFLTTLVSGVMMLLAIAGLVLQDFWMAFLAWHFSIFAKLWFLDRMARLWEIMKDASPTYQAWEKSLKPPG